MIETAFFDSNIFIYAYSLDPADEVKATIARSHLKNYLPCISNQVLQEFIATALRQPRLGITEDKIDLVLEVTADFPFVSLTHDLILHATELRRRFSVSHWDSTIMAAAHSSGCRTLFSEDLQPGFKLDQLTVVNPFA
jgi:predicted nucleic acid-binding protein